MPFQSESPVKVVEQYQLEKETSNGWSLLGIYQERSNTPIMEEVEDPNDSYSKQTLTKYHPVTLTFFVLSKPKDQALAELQERMQSRLEALSKLESELKAVQDTANRLEISNRQLAQEKANLLDANRNLTQSLQEVVDRCSRKQDQYLKVVTKIWDAVGTSNLREVLGSAFPAELESSREVQTLFQRLVEDE